VFSSSRNQRRREGDSSYRLLLLNYRERLLGSRAIECMTDNDAEQESSIFALIEIWLGGRPAGTHSNCGAMNVRA
jgi:hypothetical protein